MGRTLAVFGMLASLLCGGKTAQQPDIPRQGRSFVSFEPASSVTVTHGHKAPVSFTFRVLRGYHINSNQPTAPELIPTQLQFTPPGEVVVGKVQYPAGVLMSFPFDPTQKLSVYSGNVIIRAVVIAQSSATPGTYTVHGELKYQACDNNACYPPKKLPVEFTVKIVEAPRHRRR